MARKRRKKKIGFAALPKEMRVRIARKGGLARWAKYKRKKKKELEKVVIAWKKDLYTLREIHPEVFRKVKQEILAYTGEKDLTNGLLDLADELFERHKKNKNLQSVKIALTYYKYQHYHRGSLVELYVDGSVTYNPRSTIEGNGFVIHNGKKVA